jgi:hypothetical protein
MLGSERRRLWPNIAVFLLRITGANLPGGCGPSLCPLIVAGRDFRLLAARRDARAAAAVVVS